MITPWLQRLITKYIIWDFDGTLYQNEQLGNDIKKFFLNKAIAHDSLITETQFDKLSDTHGSWSSAVSHLNGTDEMKILSECSQKVRKVLYMREDKRIVNLIEKKLSKYHHLIFTNSTHSEVTECLDKIGFDQKTFTKIFSRDTTKILKPDPKIYSLITAFTQSPKIQHVFVGDSQKHDITPSIKMGFPAIPIWEIEKLFGQY